ncbi:AdoMet dependent proline di-methyltransferase-domain-containing protein [Chytridium lagenaria]|nr:AdoMet dependent proline di-methyltransferase-domain-containing protein [Chytridium lagenaria]
MTIDDARNDVSIEGSSWYTDAADYWEINVVSTPTPGKLLKSGIACDCGAGIGRVSKHFLLKMFDTVDLVEQNPKFLEEAMATYLTQDGLDKRVSKCFPMGLQEFKPEAGRYELIWSQWVLGHLTDSDDEDLLHILIRTENGLIGVKENLSSKELEVDTTDSILFAEAGLEILKEDIQQRFPKGLYKVKMFLLRPIRAEK